MDSGVLFGVGVVAAIVAYGFAAAAISAFFDGMPICMWIGAYKFSKGLKPGERYYYEEVNTNDNPFDEPIGHNITILDVKKSESGVVWVKYLLDDSINPITEKAFDLYRYNNFFL